MEQPLTFNPTDLTGESFEQIVHHVFETARHIIATFKLIESIAFVPGYFCFCVSSFLIPNPGDCGYRINIVTLVAAFSSSKLPGHPRHWPPLGWTWLLETSYSDTMNGCRECSRQPPYNLVRSPLERCPRVIVQCALYNG